MSAMGREDKSRSKLKSRKRAESEEARFLRYILFDSACPIVEAGCTPEQLKRARRQRRELEKQLGYEGFRKARALPPVLKESAADRRDLQEFLRQARQRIRTALKPDAVFRSGIGPARSKYPIQRAPGLRGC